MDIKWTAILFFCFCGLHSYIGDANHYLPGAHENNCSNKLITFFSSWDSACLYTAYQSADPSFEHINYEHKKLTSFISKNGRSPQVLKYRIFFYARFKDQFNISNHELKKMLDDFTQTRVEDTSPLLFLITFFNTKRENEIAQEILDKYCIDFFTTRNIPTIKGIETYLTSNSINISIESCKEIFDL